MAGNKKPQKPQKSKTFEKESWKGSVITAPLPPALVSCGRTPPVLVRRKPFKQFRHADLLPVGKRLVSGIHLRVAGKHRAFAAEIHAKNDGVFVDVNK